MEFLTLFWLDTLRIIDPRTATLDSLVEYLEPILLQAERKNKVLGKYLMELCGASVLYDDLKITDENDEDADGIEAMQKGILADIFHKNNREMYRNPPAHTRYVCIETALDCKKFVEKIL